MKTKSLDTILALGLILIVASGFAHTWQQTAPTVSYGSFGMSADGRIACTVPSTTHPLISTNYGNTWVSATNTPQWGSFYLGGAAVSADGSKIFAALSTNTTLKTWIFLTTDLGANWTKTAFPVTTTATNYCVACSADGTNVIAALGHGPIFYSTNGAANCFTSSVSPAAWTSLASSADGSSMFAAANGGTVYVSHDLGATWTPENLPVQTWSAVCTSVEGKWIGACSANQTYISSDYGVSWTTNQFGGRSIACSANGTNWLVNSSQVETSTDGGKTWQTNFSSLQWNGAAVSADGTMMLTQGSGTGTWVGRITPSPQLNIQSQDTNAAISWLTPSTNFVLQQTADLSNPVWTLVSNAPTLNFTNLNQQVSVPTGGSNTFFRLIAQ